MANINNSIKNTLFCIIVFSLIFSHIPQPLQMYFFGGEIVGTKLVFYPLFVGLIYTSYMYYKRKEVPPYFKKFLLYLALYIGIVLLSLIIGVTTYPYYDVIIGNPENNIEKATKIFEFFRSYNFDIEKKEAVAMWICLRTVKHIIIEVVYTFGGAYIIFCWYKNDCQSALKILCKAIIVSFLVLGAYSLIEIFYLAGNESAKFILECINPYIHSVKDNGSWWPPLLWNGQLRSVFAEPSYFGIYASFCIPLFWLVMLKSNFDTKCAYIYMLVTTVLTLLLVLTKARTGFLLHIGELLVLSILLIYLGNKDLCKKGIVILLCSTVAFVGGNIFIAKYMSHKHMANVSTTASITKKQVPSTSLIASMTNYVDSNAASLANPDKRSNRARYSVMEADIKVGLEHPLLGVGSGLRTAYVIDAFSEKALQNNEIKMWLDLNKRLGVLKFGIPKLGEYTSRFCETGVMGLIAFLISPIYLVGSMLRKLKIVSADTQVMYVLFLTSLAGILASGIGDTINVTYCYWVLLGLGYAICFGEKKENDN